MSAHRYVQEARKLSADELEIILTNLPAPEFVNVRLYGGFDYSGLSQQVQEVIPGAFIQASSLSGTLQNPTKEIILEIYRKELAEDRRARTQNIKRITLKDMQFVDRENKVHVEVTPYKIEIKEHAGQEPSYISELRKGLARTGFPLAIKAGSANY